MSAFSYCLFFFLSVCVAYLHIGRYKKKLSVIARVLPAKTKTSTTCFIVCMKDDAITVCIGHLACVPKLITTTSLVL